MPLSREQLIGATVNQTVNSIVILWEGGPRGISWATADKGKTKTNLNREDFRSVKEVVKWAKRNLGRGKRVVLLNLWWDGQEWRPEIKECV